MLDDLDTYNVISLGRQIVGTREWPSFPVLIFLPYHFAPGRMSFRDRQSVGAKSRPSVSSRAGARRRSSVLNAKRASVRRSSVRLSRSARDHKASDTAKWIKHISALSGNLLYKMPMSSRGPFTDVIVSLTIFFSAGMTRARVALCSRRICLTMPH